MKIDRALLAVLVVAIVLRLTFVFAFPGTGGDWSIYATVAENILRGCGVSLSNPAGTECVPHFGGNHLPGFPAYVALSWFLSDHSNDTVRIGQVLIYGLALLRLMTVVDCWWSRKAALAIGLLMAVSPLQIAWGRNLQTETLSLAAAIWVFAEFIASIDQRRLRWASIGFAVIAATFIRLDGILLCVPVATAAFWLHRPGEAIRRVAMAAIVVALPLAAWAARNVAVGLPSVFPEPMVFPQTAPAPMGYIRWGNTWISEEYQRMGLLWPITRFNYTTIQIDDKAYDSPAEKAKVEAWVVELKNFAGKPFPADIDVRFAQLARERTAQHPFRTYLVLPALRAWALWKSPFNSFGWPSELPSSFGDQNRLEASRSWARIIDLVIAYPGRASAKVLTGGYKFLLLIAFAAIAIAALAGTLSRTRPIAWIAVSWVIARTLFFAITNNVETRYTVPAVPAMELVATLGIVESIERRRAAAGRGDRSITAPSSS